MKFIKVLLLILLLIVGVWVVMCLAGPKSFDTSRSIEINQTTENVWPFVADLTHWNQWSPWEKQDPDMDMVISSPSMGPGAKMTWTSQVVGSGSLRITDEVYAQRLGTALSFEGFDSESLSDFIFEDIDGRTRLTWTMTGSELPFLFRGFMVLMNPVEAINKDYDQGLAEIKRLSEAMEVELPEEEEVEQEVSLEVLDDETAE